MRAEGRTLVLFSASYPFIGHMTYYVWNQSWMDGVVIILTKWSLYAEGVQLNTHRGINNMARTPLWQYPSLMKAAYIRWWSFLITINSISCSLLAQILFHIFTMMFLGVAIIDSIIVFRKGHWKGVFLAGMFLIVPIAVNLMEIMARYVVERMMYGFAADVKDEKEYKDLPEVQVMNTYPNDDSIKIIDGVVVIKLSDE